MSIGLERAGFNVLASVEIDNNAASAYKLNHTYTKLYECDIRQISGEQIKKDLGINELDLLAGCPPCQGFSSIRRKNKRMPRRDERNHLILEFQRLIQELEPKTVLLENVPAIQNYYLFTHFLRFLESTQYEYDCTVLNASDYLVPQRRRRFVLLASRIGKPILPIPNNQVITVRNAIGELETVEETNDPLHKLHSHHSDRILDLISHIPPNGGSRTDLPETYTLECHKKDNVGFHDVYGRMAWDDVAPTITGGCQNPSKGRYLHPEENRSITIREAMLLQTFPPTYQLPLDISKTAMALMIGNALPPKFAELQAKVLYDLLLQNSLN